jgi:hypothetical protein
VELQVSTPLAGESPGPPSEHTVVVGAHEPVQPPSMHAWLVQGVAVPQVPVPSQVCTPFDEHWEAPGVHASHAPFTQTGVPPVQAVGLPQLPVGSQLCTPVPLVGSVPPAHCVVFGEHTPPQQPPPPPSQPVVLQT